MKRSNQYRHITVTCRDCLVKYPVEIDMGRDAPIMQQVPTVCRECQEKRT